MPGRVRGVPADLLLGTLNTALLLTSSLTMVLALDAARRGLHRATRRLLLLTALLGAVFLALKATEYAQDWAHHLVPGFVFDLPTAPEGAGELFRPLPPVDPLEHPRVLVAHHLRHEEEGHIGRDHPVREGAPEVVRAARRDPGSLARLDQPPADVQPGREEHALRSRGVLQRVLQQRDLEGEDHRHVPLGGAVATRGTALVVTAAVDALPGRLFRLRRP